MNKQGDMGKAKIESFDILLFADRRGSCKVIVTRAVRDESGKASLYSEAEYDRVSGFTLARLLNACPTNPDHLRQMDIERLLSKLEGN